jgi:hypothetical protein
MPTLDQFAESEVVKMLYLGDSGSGKTGSLASLACAGYRLVVLDYDSGIQTLAKMIQHDCKSALARVHYATLTDKFKSNPQGKVIPAGTPKAFAKGMGLLTEWKPKDGEALGSPTEWGQDTILIIDSMTMLANAALRHVLAANGRSGAHPQIQDWGEAMRMIEEMLGLLYGESVGCHVIITSHLTFMESETGGVRGYPNALGSKLPPKVGRYFNTILLAKSMGSGQSMRRKIRTVSEGTIELKNPDPYNVPAELDLSSGLREFFKIITGRDGPGSKT